MQDGINDETPVARAAPDKPSSAEAISKELVRKFQAFKDGSVPAKTEFKWKPGPGSRLPRFRPHARRFVVAYGRSRIGKSFCLEYIANMALQAGMSVALADFDRDNASLTSRFPDGTIRLPNGLDPYFDRGLIDLHKGQISADVDLMLDIGFGSARSFRTFAAKHGFQKVQEEAGTRPVLVLPLSPNLDDLMPIELLSGVYMPRDILLIVNEGLVDPDRDVAIEYETVLSDPRILGLLDRGARTLHMPRLPNGVRFHNTKRPFDWASRSDWDNPLDPFEREGANVFLQTARRRCEKLADIIPFPTGAKG